MLVAVLCGTYSIAFAEQNDVKLVLEEGEGADGEVVFSVSLKENDGVSDLYLRVEYDTDALELVGRNFGKALSSLDPTDNYGDDEADRAAYEPPYLVEYLDYSQKNVTETGYLFSLRFRVKEGAKNGNHSVKLVVRQVGYRTGDSSLDLIYNEQYGARVDAEDYNSLVTGGLVVAEKIVVVSGGEVDSVVTPDEEKDGANELMIGLIVGGVMILVGAVVVAYIVYRRKNAGKAAQ